MIPQVTVLGASGYLGSAVAAVLSRRPVNLRLVGRSFGAANVASSGRHDVRVVDLTVPGAVADAVAGSENVINLVADVGGRGRWRRRPDEGYSDALEIGVLRDVLDEFGSDPGQSPGGMVFASTTALNTPGTGPAGTAYERNKRSGEEMVLQAAASGVVRGTCIRLPTLFGVPSHGDRPGRGAVHVLIGQALAGSAIRIWGDGRNTRNLLHVDDAAAAFADALEHLDVLGGRTWDIGTNREITLRAAAELISSAAARATGTGPVPVESVRPPAEATDHDLGDAVVAAEPFMRATGWRPRRQVTEALDDTVRLLATEAKAGALQP